VRVPRRLDLLALSGCALSAAVTVLYVFLVTTQGAAPAWWAVLVLVVAIGCSGYGMRVAAPYRRTALIISGVGLIALGYLALLSIGLPLLLAGSLCVAAALRARPTKDWRDLV
jgi:hypothetical protein